MSRFLFILVETESSFGFLQIISTRPPAMSLNLGRPNTSFTSSLRYVGSLDTSFASSSRYIDVSMVVFVQDSP